MNRTKPVTSLALLLGLAASTAGAATDVEQVRACMRANTPTLVQVRELAIEAVDRAGGSRMLRARLYGLREGDRMRSMIRVYEPPDLAGAAYLFREEAQGDQLWVFLPSLNRVKRITGKNAGGALWGTDLSYDDVRQLQSAFAGATLQALPDAELQARAVHVLQATPAPQQEADYSLIVAQVDQQTCVPLLVQFSDAAGVKRSIESDAAHLRQAGGRWYAERMTVSDLRNGTRSTLRVEGVKFDQKVPTRTFRPDSFHFDN